MEIGILHVPGERMSRIQRVREHPMISAGYFCPILGRELLFQTWGNLPEEILELCLPYLNVRDRSCYRAVCTQWKRVIDGLPKDHFPGKYWLYATPATGKRKSKYGWEEPRPAKLRKAGHVQDNTLFVDVINLGRLEHLQVRDTGNMLVVVAQHMVGFISKAGVLVFNPLATGREQACSRYQNGFPAQPTFAGLYSTPGTGFVTVVGRLTSDDNVLYVIHSCERMVSEIELPEELSDPNRCPIGSATHYRGRLYWPTRFGDVVSVGEMVAFEEDWTPWEHLGKPTGEGESLVWHQGIFVWNDGLYYLGYVQVGGKEVNTIWRLNQVSDQGSPWWEEQEMLPSHPCDSRLPLESQGQEVEIVLVSGDTVGEGPAC